MSTFNPEKLTVFHMNGTTATAPVIPRRYTLTHSDTTGELFLHIASVYAWNNINTLRDEVIGEWKVYGNSFVFCASVHLDEGEYELSIVAKRNEIFRQELPLALEAIRYGDMGLFMTYPCLSQTPIIIQFHSMYPQYAKKEVWGTFQHFIS